MFFFNQAFLHLSIGCGLGIAIVVFFSFKGRRRPFFRFGGESRFSLVVKKSWMLWYLVAYVFEFLTSFLRGVGDRMYVELALSIYQALFVTLGLFIIDRLASIFVEPEEYFVSPSKKTASRHQVSAHPETITLKAEPVLDTPVLEQRSEVPAESEKLGTKTAGPTILGRKFAEITADVATGVGEAGAKLASLPNMIKTVYQEHRAEVDAQEVEAEEHKKQERQKRLKNLDDSLKGY